MAAGTNHVLALNNKGKVFAWGAGEQNQLARRVVARTATGALVPREFGLGRKKIVHIGCGDYHSYAVDNSGNVYAWGLNSLGECGSEPGDEDSATIPTPTLIDNLRGFDVQQIVGGSHHTLALTKDGRVLVWGGVANKQAGVDLSTLPPDSYFKSKDGRILYLKKPVVVPGIDGVYIATGPDTCAAISKDGKAYTWGFNDNYQAGQGQVDEVPIAQWVDNTAVRGKKLVFAGIGGQFGVFGGIPADD
jgi:regulator of chromosome condensation